MERKKAQLRNKLVRGFQKAQIDFSESKCSGDGLGTKNGSVISLKMLANLIQICVFSTSFCDLSADDRQDRRSGFI